MDLPCSGISRSTRSLHGTLRLPGAAQQAAGRRWLQSQPCFRICPESGSAALAPPPHLPGHRWSRCWGGRLEALDLGTDDSWIHLPASGGSSSISPLICQRDGGSLYKAPMCLFLMQESDGNKLLLTLTLPTTALWYMVHMTICQLYI